VDSRYIRTWLRVLQNNPRRIVDAAHQTSRAVDDILGCSRPITKEE
jgi:antirestriction protein ArdC